MKPKSARSCSEGDLELLAVNNLLVDKMPVDSSDGKTLSSENSVTSVDERTLVPVKEVNLSMSWIPEN